MTDNGPYSHMSAEDGEKALRELLESGMDVTGIDASDIAPEGLKCKLLKHQIQVSCCVDACECG